MRALKFLEEFMVELEASIDDLKDIYSDALSVYEPSTLDAMRFCITGLESHLEMLETTLYLEKEVRSE